MGISTTMYSPITSALEHWSTFIYRSVESLAVVGLCQKSYYGNYAPWVIPLLHPSPCILIIAQVCSYVKIFLKNFYKGF